MGVGLILVQKLSCYHGLTIFVAVKQSAMIKLIAIMLLGVLGGYLLRRVEWVKRLIPHSTTLTILILLLIMGFEIGGNSAVMRNMLRLGGEAVVIAVAATFGSIVAARIIYRVAFKRKEGRNG